MLNKCGIKVPKFIDVSEALEALNAYLVSTEGKVHLVDALELLTRDLKTSSAASAAPQSSGLIYEARDSLYSVSFRIKQF